MRQFSSWVVFVLLSGFASANTNSFTIHYNGIADAGSIFFNDKVTTTIHLEEIAFSDSAQPSAETISCSPLACRFEKRPSEEGINLVFEQDISQSFQTVSIDARVHLYRLSVLLDSGTLEKEKYSPEVSRHCFDNFCRIHVMGEIFFPPTQEQSFAITLDSATEPKFSHYNISNCKVRVYCEREKGQ